MAEMAQAFLANVVDFEGNMGRYTLTRESYVTATYVYAVVLVLMCWVTLVVFGVKRAGRGLNTDAAQRGPPGLLEGILRRRACKTLSKGRHEYEVAWRTDSSKSAKPSWHTKQEMIDWGFQRAVERRDEEEVAMKRLSWILSCVNSFALTVIGAVYAYHKLKAPFSYDSLQSRDNVSQLVALWFAMFNITDLVFGSIVYPEQMDPLTAYVHHPLFIYIMYACTTGHYGFNPFTLQPVVSDGFAPTFLLMCVEELPTFILGLGSVFSALRLDVGFGLTFFLLRIVYHGYVLVQAVSVGVQPLVTGLFCLTMTMHLYWFYGWIKSYMKKRPAAERNIKSKGQ